ncbi:MAG: prolipoprotein diacylglyceryl transferase [Elusimicrobia bacterium RIFOXYA12_FULL_51_18]|nr:MAG: prolipoprotein diacylglyceryl transferase [Elusimicrobia bacterium RIFOXYA12_FULL_51_18]OGS31888.1 MAG: prolipoprotein diacylglyceryl transferase [Elusimicrobia bacterium RIFOXYA2_FULL_53_38]
MHPFLLHFGGFKLPAYGFTIALGYTAAIFYLYKSRAIAFVTRDQEADLVFYSALAGILGAKAVFAATYWTELGPDFASRFVYIFKGFPYGFVFYGGFAAGAAAFFLYCRRNKLNFLKTADHFAPALALAHGFGRLGCFMAGCCYGRPAGGALGVAFTDPMCEVPQAYLGVPLHPVQLYEAAGNFLIFGALAWLSRRGKVRAGGMIFAVYILAYSFLRFMVEFLRGDDRGGSWLGLSPAQTLSIIAASAAIFMITRMRKK